MTIDHKRMALESGNKYSMTMRVNRHVYRELARLKAIYEERLNAELKAQALEDFKNFKPRRGRGKQKQVVIPSKEVSFSDFLRECCKLGELLMTGQEVYSAAGKLFKDVESARGEAIVASIKSGKPAEAPLALLVIGKDDGLT